MAEKMAVDETRDRLIDQFREEWAEASNLHRRTLAASNKAGVTLQKVKDRTPQGYWGAWWEAEGLSKSTVYRLLELAELPVSQLGNFTSDHEALTWKRQQVQQKQLPIQNVTPEPKVDNAVPFGEAPDDAEKLSGSRASRPAMDGALLAQVQGIWRTGESLSAVKRALPTGTAFEAFLDAENVPAGQADFILSLSHRYDFDTLPSLDAYSIVEQWEGALNEV